MAPTLGAHPGDTLRVSTGFASKGGVTGWAAQTGTPPFVGAITVQDTRSWLDAACTVTKKYLRPVRLAWRKYDVGRSTVNY